MVQGKRFWINLVWLGLLMVNLAGPKLSFGAPEPERGREGAPPPRIAPPAPVEPRNNPPAQPRPNPVNERPNPPENVRPNNQNPPVNVRPNNPNPPVTVRPNNPNPPVPVRPNNPNPPVIVRPNPVIVRPPGHPGTIVGDPTQLKYQVPPGSWKQHPTTQLPQRQTVPIKKGFDNTFKVTKIDPPNLTVNNQLTFTKSVTWKNNTAAVTAKFKSNPYSQKSKDLFAQTSLKYKNSYKNYVNKWTAYQSYFKGPYATYYKYYWNQYFPFGFLGGFWYPTWPLWNISIYFGYPNVYWLYADVSDADVYQEWNGGVCDAGIFPYAGAFFYTQTTVALGTEMSALPPDLFCNYRRAMTIAMNSIAQQISDYVGYNFVIGEGEVVLNNYTNLQNQAVTIEGYVAQGDVQRPYKADLDLQNPENTTAFVPSSPTPTAQDVESLDKVNGNIVSQGGDPLQANQNPDPPAQLLIPPADPSAVPTPP